jgi:hypothetical protein
MVERKESTGLDSFEGIVENVEFETGGLDDRRQYHVTIECTSHEIGGATGKLHEWIPMSPKSTEDSVPQGSVMDRYLTQVEMCISEAKKAATIQEALNLMVGKKFQFQRVKLGKDYEGHSAKDYIVPTRLI